MECSSDVTIFETIGENMRDGKLFVTDRALTLNLFLGKCVCALTSRVPCGHDTR